MISFEEITVSELYAAVASSTSIRLFFALMAHLDLECLQFDVTTAFLHAKLPNDVFVYVRQPTGFSDGTNRVCRLRRALYGLRGSPSWWLRTFQGVLKELGFKSLLSNIYLFRH